MLKEALCGEAGASSPRTLADACWVLRVGWKIGVLLQEDDSDADAQELVKFFCAPGFRAAGVAGGANEMLHAFPSESVRVHLRLCLHPSVLVSTSDSCCMCACRSRACTRRDSS